MFCCQKLVFFVFVKKYDRRAKESSPTPQWGHRLPVTALVTALSARARWLLVSIALSFCEHYQQVTGGEARTELSRLISRHLEELPAASLSTGEWINDGASKSSLLLSPNGNGDTIAIIIKMHHDLYSSHTSSRPSHNRPHCADGGTAGRGG